MGTPLRGQTRPRSALIEQPEALRLERIADTFTARLEYERKQGLLLTEQIRLREEDLKARKDATRLAVTSTNPEERRLRGRIAALEHQIHLITANIADTQTGNMLLRAQIDGYRRDQRNYKQAITSLNSDLHEIKDKSGLRGQERLKLTDEDMSQRQHLAVLRCRSVQSHQKHRIQVQELESVIKQDLQVREGFFKSLEENFKVSMMRALETLDPSPVMQALLQKWRRVRGR